MELYCEFTNFSSLNGAKEIFVFSREGKKKIKASKKSKPPTFKTSLAPVLDLLAYFLFLYNLHMALFSRDASLFSSCKRVALFRLWRAGHAVAFPALKPS